MNLGGTFDLQVDPAEADRRKRTRLVHLNTQVIPRLRVLGFIFVAIGAVNALVAAIARSEQSTVRLERNAEYLAHVAASRTHPHISALTAPPSGGTDPLPAILRGVLVGLLPT